MWCNHWMMDTSRNVKRSAEGGVDAHISSKSRVGYLGGCEQRVKDKRKGCLPEVSSRSGKRDGILRGSTKYRVLATHLRPCFYIVRSFIAQPRCKFVGECRVYGRIILAKFPSKNSKEFLVIINCIRGKWLHQEWKKQFQLLTMSRSSARGSSNLIMATLDPQNPTKERQMKREIKEKGTQSAQMCGLCLISLLESFVRLAACLVHVRD